MTGPNDPDHDTVQGVNAEQSRIVRYACLFGKHYVWVHLADGTLALHLDPQPPRRHPLH
ncbi:hypothetical protein ACIP4S_13105 [Streptomyces chartreusis]|uniref:hypothetical protein n=1 Tax=Streptomyces chartreusis TaxID=1969 RepID=UPI003808CDE8